MSSNIGMVSTFFANHAFADIRLWCIPDSWYMSMYTAAAVPSPLESQNACRSKAWTGFLAIVRLRANLSSPGHFPLNFSYCVFSFLGKTVSQERLWSHASLKTIFPTKVTGLATARGSYIAVKLLSMCLCVAFCESLEKVIARVSFSLS